MTNDRIKFVIDQEEWQQFPPDKQEKLSNLLSEYFGVDVESMISYFDEDDE